MTQDPVVVSAGRAEHLAESRVAVVQAGGREVAVFDVGGCLVALDARCLHRGGPLAEGFVRDGIVTCPWHWWRYDLLTGERLGAPDLRLTRYRAWVEDGEVRVEVPPAEGPAPIREVLLRHAREWEAERAGDLGAAG